MGYLIHLKVKEELQQNDTPLLTVYCKHIEHCSVYNLRNSRESNKINKSKNIRKDPYLGLTEEGRNKKIVEKEPSTRMAFSRT